MNTGNRPLLLVLGVDKYVLDACQRHDVETVVAWGAGAYDYGLQQVPDGITVLRVDEASSAEAVLMALHRAGLADRQFDAVQTSDEWALVTAGVLGRYLNCRAIDASTAVFFRDKTLQKQRLSQAGIPTARAMVIDDIYDVSGLDALPYERAVLKPIAGAATARTSVVTSLADLRARSRQFRRERAGQRTFALEEYVGGDEWVADGVVFDGRLIFCALGRYAIPCLNVVDERLPLLLRRFDPEVDKSVYDRGVPVVRAALAALGLRDGVFHMELFHDDATGTLTFSECAARRGGALVHEEVQVKFGVHLGEAALLCALGRAPDLQVKVRPEAIGSSYLMGRPGTLYRCPTPAQMRALPGVEHVRIEFAFGAQISDEGGSTNYRIGQVLASAPNEEALERRLAELRAWFDAQLVVAPFGVPMREQRQWQQAKWPDEDFGDQLCQ